MLSDLITLECNTYHKLVNYTRSRDLTYYVNKKQVIPMTYGMPKDRPLGGSGPGVQGAFPEIEEILNAMKHLTQMGFNPRDMHTENIMMRADTNQLVMTDVGLFLVTKG